MSMSMSMSKTNGQAGRDNVFGEASWVTKNVFLSGILK